MRNVSRFRPCAHCLTGTVRSVTAEQGSQHDAVKVQLRGHEKQLNITTVPCLSVVLQQHD
eukprot:1152751-Pelagomonas_calceolata.AAC.4